MFLPGAVLAVRPDAERARRVDARPLDETGFERMPKPKPGDWLWVFPEKPQSFAEYVASRPTRFTKKRNRVYVQPFPPRRESTAVGLERQVLTKALQEYGLLS